MDHGNPQVLGIIPLEAKKRLEITNLEKRLNKFLPEVDG